MCAPASVLTVTDFLSVVDVVCGVDLSSVSVSDGELVEPQTVFSLSKAWRQLCAGK